MPPTATNGARAIAAGLCHERCPSNRIDHEHHEPLHFPSPRCRGAARGRHKSDGLISPGVVFGDIGTSPLYTLKTVLGVTGAEAAGRAAALGSLSWPAVLL